MTTQAMVPDRRHWWQYAGPWPLYPLADALVAGLVTLSTRSFIMTADTVPIEIFTAIVFGLTVFIILEVARRYMPRIVTTFPGYLATLLVATVVATLVRFAQGYIPDYPTLSTAGDLVFAIIRAFVGLVIIQSIIGSLQERLQRQVDATQEALDIVEAQAEALLKADEEVRRSVATLLHDRVQGGLLAACLRLQSVALEHPSSREEVDRVIHELEQLRSLDVRRAVRTLSPSLKDVDLETAISELAEPYLPALAVSISVPRDAVADPTLRLAAYRIIEQGLLNAIDHGGATHVAIGIECPPGRVEITVRDDGRGLGASRTPGFGTMLVDTWCRSLGGTWRLQPGSGHGAVLTATLPATEERRSTPDRG